MSKEKEVEFKWRYCIIKTKDGRFALGEVTFRYGKVYRVENILTIRAMTYAGLGDEIKEMMKAFDRREVIENGNK